MLVQNGPRTGYGLSEKTRYELSEKNFGLDHGLSQSYGNQIVPSLIFNEK